MKVVPRLGVGRGPNAAGLRRSRRALAVGVVLHGDGCAGRGVPVRTRGTVLFFSCQYDLAASVGFPVTRYQIFPDVKRRVLHGSDGAIPLQALARQDLLP